MEPQSVDSKPNQKQIPEQEPDFHEFKNDKVEQLYKMQKDLYIINDQRLSNQQDPNPNKSVRIIRKIFQNYIFLSRCIKNMKFFLENYKQTILIINQKKKIQLRLRNEAASMSPEQIAQAQYTITNANLALPLIINEITLMKFHEEKQQLLYCINKLKVMVSKARYRQSTSLEYLTQSYVGKLKETMTSSVRVRGEKRERSCDLTFLAIDRHSLVICVLLGIKSKFVVIDLKGIRYQKICPTDYLLGIRRHIIQFPIFFINFCSQQLLFVEKRLINFPTSILYCPIVLLNNKKSVSISEEYMTNLTILFGEWAKFQLVAQIYHPKTSHQYPIYVSHLLGGKKKLEMPPERGLNERWKKEFKTLQKMIETLTNIRNCVFSKMFQAWINRIFDNTGKQIVEFWLHNKFKIQIRGVYSNQRYEEEISSGFLPQNRPQIITDILILASQRANIQKSKKMLRQMIQSHFQASIFKILAEKTASRVSWPLQPGSLGNHYYEYLNDKTPVRLEIANFFGNF